MQQREANISSFQSRLVSLWPSFFLHSQSLHLCLTVSFPLPSAGQDFSVLHPHSISCLVLRLLRPHPSPPRTLRCTPSSLHIQPDQIQIEPSLGLSTDTLLFGHFIGLNLAIITSQHLHHRPTETVTLIIQILFQTMPCPFVRAFNTRCWRLVYKGDVVLRCRRWCFMWHWLIFRIYFEGVLNRC